MTTNASTAQLFIILQLYVIFQGTLFVGASIRSDGKSYQDNDANPQDTSRDEMKPKIEDEHHYYLPTESVSDSARNPSAFGGSATSPPLITIDPASVHSVIEQSMDPLAEPDSYINDDYIIPYASHCVSDLPSNAESEYLSELLTPSKKLIPEPVVLSGHIEIASKTSDDDAESKKANKASESSVVLQGSHIYMPSVTESE